MEYHMIKCLNCGDHYGTNYGRTKFCSKGCAAKYKYKQRYRVIRKVSCQYCGLNFSTYKLNRKYCSKKCSLEWVEEQRSKKQAHGLIRWKILIRDRFTCQYCGRTPQQGIILHVDHMDPKNNGGQDIKENLITACEDCNEGKFKKYYGEVFTYLKDKNFDFIL